MSEEGIKIQQPVTKTSRDGPSWGKVKCETGAMYILWLHKFLQENK